MKRSSRKLIIIFLFLFPLLAYQGCKKQPKCGCGKDVIFELKNAKSYIQQKSEGFIAFYSDVYQGATFYFCRPETWIDSLNNLNTSNYLLISGKAYYEPVYQVEVSSVKEDNYGK
jgi:hypothetical protein